MEVAGPLGTPLGLAQRKRASPRLNLARNYADSKENTQLAPCRRAAGYKEASSFAEMVCLGKGMFFDFSELGDLPHGRLNTNLKISSAEKGQCHLRLAVDSSMFPVLGKKSGNARNTHRHRLPWSPGRQKGLSLPKPVTRIDRA